MAPIRWFWTRLMAPKRRLLFLSLMVAVFLLTVLIPPWACSYYKSGSWFVLWRPVYSPPILPDSLWDSVELHLPILLLEWVILGAIVIAVVFRQMNPIRWFKCLWGALMIPKRRLLRLWLVVGLFLFTALIPPWACKLEGSWSILWRPVFFPPTYTDSLRLDLPILFLEWVILGGVVVGVVLHRRWRNCA